MIREFLHRINWFHGPVIQETDELVRCATCDKIADYHRIYHHWPWPNKP
ncbi:hypothetical protein LCGC14_2796530, partial [marine sediment metagenome]